MKLATTLYLVDLGPRPPFASIAHHLWGDADFDSDGNSTHPGDTNWTELTVTRRPGYEERIDIDPVSERPLVLKISSKALNLAELTASFLATTTGGIVVPEWP